MLAAQLAVDWWINRIALAALTVVSIRFTYRIWQEAREESSPPGC